MTEIVMSEDEQDHGQQNETKDKHRTHNTTLKTKAGVTRTLQKIRVSSFKNFTFGMIAHEAAIHQITVEIKFYRSLRGTLKDLKRNKGDGVRILIATEVITIRGNL